jgi:hypothetical protein
MSCSHLAPFLKERPHLPLLRIEIAQEPGRTIVSSLSSTHSIELEDV